MRSCVWAGVASVVLFTGAASAQVNPVGPFTGDLQEGFESFPKAVVPQLACFGGGATANQVGGLQGLYTINAWFYFGGIFPHSGGMFMGGTSGVIVEWVFDQPARRFGGYFGTNYSQPGATATFYDEAGAVMATLPVACPNGGQWAWSGWEATGAPFKRVLITGSDPGSGHIMHDDLELTMDSCYPDCNGVGGLTVADFACFQTRFVAGDPYADCNGAGGLTIADFGCFQTAFVAGCP